MTSRATLPLYLVSSATSLFGNASISIVLPWLVLLRTGDAAVAGLVAAASAMPSALAALIGGHLADRFGRRTITVLADVGSAVSVAALAVVDLTIGLSVPWFIALGVLGALFDVPGMTAREAMVADVARTSGVSLDRVAALRGALFGVSFLAGPALAGGLLALIPATNVVWVTAASSALAAGTMLAMPLARSAEGDQGDDASPFAGFGLVRRTPVLWSMLVISLASAVLVAPLLAVVLPAHFQGLGRPELLGFSVSAYAVGTIVGSVLYGALFGDRRRPAWVASMGLMMVGFAAVATLDRVLAVAVGMALAGVGGGLQQPIIMVVLTRAVPEAVRARVFGVYSAAAMLVAPVGLGAASGIIAGWGLDAVARVIAGLWLLVGLWAVATPSLRDYLRTLTEEDADADHQPAG